MTTFANIAVVAETEGTTYVSAVTMPTANADTDLLATPKPVPTLYNEAMSASVEFTVNGSPATNSTFVVLQGDFGDGVWYDLAWALSTVTTGTDNFFLGAGNGSGQAFRQTRVAGAAPASTGNNSSPMPGRVRFVGRSVLTGGASPTVTVTVIYRLQPLR